MPKPRPEGAPPLGFTSHVWQAALTIPIRPHEVTYYQKKADSAPTKSPTTGRVEVRRTADVVDVFCRRCGARPGRQEWCVIDPMRDVFR